MSPRDHRFICEGCLKPIEDHHGYKYVPKKPPSIDGKRYHYECVPKRKTNDDDV